MQELRVNGKRLWESIMETAKFGATSRSGVSRLSLSDEDRRVRGIGLRRHAGGPGVR